MLIIDFAELLSILISDFNTSICSIFNFKILYVSVYVSVSIFLKKSKYNNVEKHGFFIILSSDF